MHTRDSRRLDRGQRLPDILRLSDPGWVRIRGFLLGSQRGRLPFGLWMRFGIDCQSSNARVIYGISMQLTPVTFKLIHVRMRETGVTVISLLCCRDIGKAEFK